MTLDCWSVSTDIHGAPSVLLMVLISAIIKYEVQLNMSLVCLKDTLIVLLAKTTHPLSPLINSPDSIAHIKGLTYLSDYGVIRTCLGGAM